MTSKQNITLDEARALYRSKVGAGVECPCCDRYGKVYKRRLCSAIAFGLIAMHRRYVIKPDEWIHFQRYMAAFCKHRPGLSAAVRGGDFAKMRWLGLIEARDSDAKRPSSGFWRLTPRGASFVKGEIRVPAYIWTYGNQQLDIEVDETISIEEALNDPFDYQELMRSEPPKTWEGT